VVGLAWFASRRSLGAAVASVGVVLLALIELWPVSNRVMEPALGDPIQRNLELGRDDIVDFLQKAGPAGTFRVLPSQEFQSNRLAGFGIASVGGYHAAKPRLAQDFLDARLADHPAWMRLLNVRYLILPQQLPNAPPYLTLVHSGTSYTGQPSFVYENQLALPRATVVGAYRVVTPAIAILDSVAAHTVDAADVTYLEEDPKLTLGPVANAHADIASYRLNDVTIDVDTPGPGLLRLADLWYPDWTVTVDGKPARLLKADYLLRAVPVPAGKHRVVFRFESQAMRRGLMLSIGSLVVVLALFALDFVMRRRRAAPAPAAVAASGAVAEGR
jgi:Bacterial membrane protein YfhO